MAKDASHLRVIDGNIARLNIPTIVEFEMKDIVSALKDLTTSKKFIKASVSKGKLIFIATNNGVGNYTFLNPLGSNPQQAMSKDRDVYETVRRYVCVHWLELSI